MGGCPYRNDGCRGVEHIGHGNGKFTAEEHHGYGHTEEYAAHTSVEEQEYVVGACAVEVARFTTIFVADGLEHEAYEDKHPQPVCTTE